MKRAYLDNAGTTAIHPEVIAEMARVMADIYGNPSSTHSFGRSAKVVLETSRKTIAALLNAEAREIIFTSGGTEANNFILRSAVKDLGVKRIISSRVEHHSVLTTLPQLAAEFGIKIDYINLTQGGFPDYRHLRQLLDEGIPTLVSLMYVNNETGVMADIERIGNMCREYNAYFHTDTVQAVGKTELDLKNLPVDFIVASAHKFHGPKGVGFAYIRKNIAVQPMIYGGEQEKGLRAGTEAIHQIAGMAKALELSYKNLNEEREHITGLKNYLFEQLDMHFAGYKVNGLNAQPSTQLFYNITNILLPFGEDKTAMILFHLDMLGVAVSRGSACQSGSVRPSHVLEQILPAEDIKKPSLRISFSHFNTREDIDLFIDALGKI
ncbi:cysteine desulfurase [Flavobacterium akiainvivens]|uniref:cysteine desulfurase n=1 Tax=Flavobacterium akiainvivens TaxID=1202724 RepID=A0A0M8MB13_9FLAO|nr:cysteine desulfurase family protein [Flavobacterium akiainvivens]KOS04924.1 cysteine desulfurase [Flavobacterium akiainvivens]SFQ42067.1 cysteine desulfurase [Flavobacterium akiainvivens]